MTSLAPVESVRGAPAVRGMPETVTAAIDLSIVIVNWNTRELLRDCLASIETNRGRLKLEIIVVDNGSCDGSTAMIEREFKDVTLIANDENRGFAAANNQGLRVARGRYLLLLNSDTRLIGDVLTRTITFADAHPNTAVVGCQVLENEQTVQRTSFRFPSPLNTLLWVTGLSGCLPRSRVFGRASYGPWPRDDEREVDVVSGMYMLVRREAMEQVGLMDECYFVFVEEADWCYRFHRAGWDCRFAPVGRIVHVDGGSKSTTQVGVKMYVEMQKNLLRFHRRHLGLAAWATTKALFAMSMPLRAAWWTACSMINAGDGSAHRATQARAASLYHWTGREPQW
jgi:GT2 family glycosyltransferase